MVKLSPEDVIELKKAGATEGLLAAILSTSGSAVKTPPGVVAPGASDSYVPSTPRIYVTAPSVTPGYYDNSYQDSSYYSPYSPYYYPYVGFGFGYYGGRYWGGHYGGHPYYGGGHGGYGGGGHGGGGHGGHR
jgi:hypothetical protein